MESGWMSFSSWALRMRCRSGTRIVYGGLATRQKEARGILLAGSTGSCIGASCAACCFRDALRGGWPI
eukprot:7412543-Ditylum_brightwellii.AAC.1